MNAVPAESAHAIDTFIDALWLEEGLSKNTLEAYRRDLTQLASWLAPRSLDVVVEHDLQAYFSHNHSGSKATTANRRLTVFKRYFRWGLRERRFGSDPTLKLQAAKQVLRVPKTLTEAQVEALLAAPDVSQALGIRDRTMLELMYASGLRVSELVSLKTLNVGLNMTVCFAFWVKAPKSDWFHSVKLQANGCATTLRNLAQNCWLGTRLTICLSPCGAVSRVLP